MHLYFRGRCRTLAGRTLSFAPTVLAGLLALPASLASAQQTPTTPPQTPAADAATYTLIRVFKAGDADRYRLKVHVTGTDSQSANQDVKLDFRFRENVKEIKPDGSRLLTDVFDKAVAQINGLEQDVTAFMPTLTRTIDKKGQPVSVTVEGGLDQLNVQLTPMFESMGKAQAEFYPQQPVKVGDTWKVDQSDPKEPAEKTTGTATLVGLETVGGVPSLKIKIVTDTKTKAPDPASTSGAKVDITIHFDGTCNLDPKTGKLVKLSGTGLRTLVGAQTSNGKTTIETELALVTGPDDDKADSAKPKPQ